MFKGDMDQVTRRKLLFSKNNFDNTVKKIPDDLYNLKLLARNLRGLLVENYEREEKKGIDPILLMDGGSLHDNFLTCFNRFPCQNIKIESILVQQKRSVEEVNSKRSTYDTRDDGERPEKKLKCLFCA